MERGIPIWQANADMYSSEKIMKSSWANGNNIAYLLNEADKIKRNYILSEVEDYRKKLGITRKEYKIIKLE